MRTYGVIYQDGRKELVSIVLDENDEPRLDTLAPYPTPEDWVDPQIIPLVKLDPPADNQSYESTIVWYDDRVERQWVPAPTLPPPAATYTAEEWLAAQGYTPLRLLTCLDLEAKLRAAGAASPTLAAVRQWLDALTLAAAAAPDQQRPDWPPAPHPFDAVLAESLAALQP